MTDPTTDDPAREPADDAQAAAAVAREATEGGAHLEALAARAKEIRGPGYDGSLTVALLIDLGELLRQATPAKYVKFIPPATGKPYPSIGLNSAQFQIDVMNAVLGRPHWRILRHYPPGKDGFICKVVVLVGNRLAAASLDDHGELIAADADILGVGQEWGAVKHATTPADAYKGSATNATKRAIAEFGPGADVYRKDFQDENIGGTGALEPPAAASASRRAARACCSTPAIASFTGSTRPVGRAASSRPRYSVACGSESNWRWGCWAARRTMLASCALSSPAARARARSMSCCRVLAARGDCAAAGAATPGARSAPAPPMFSSGNSWR